MISFKSTISQMGALSPLNGKQPRNLFKISFIQFWERFGFYTMRGLMVLYMTKILLLSNRQAYTIFSTFSALLYLTPLIGGHIADSLLGSRRGFLFGSILLTLGYLILAIDGYYYLYLGLGTVIIGSGFFTPNIATAVGQLYFEGDPRRESGFSIFYSVINLGACLPPLFTAWSIFTFGWHSAFICSAISTAISTLFIFLTYKADDHFYTKFSLSKIKWLLLILGVTAMTLIFTELLRNAKIANIVLIFVSIAFIIYVIKRIFEFQEEQRNKLWVCLILTLYSVIFWILDQQGVMSLTIFTEYNVQRHLNNWMIPTIMFQSFGPLFIILGGPALAKLWLWLDKKNLNPSIPAKFALGTMLTGMGFVLLSWVIFAAHGRQINCLWIVISYFLQNMGELLLSPVGLSMISELSPLSIVGLMMGVWYFATALANFLAGYVAVWTTTTSGSNDPILTNLNYAHTFNILGYAALAAGLLTFLFAAKLARIIAPASQTLVNQFAIEP